MTRYYKVEINLFNIEYHRLRVFKECDEVLFYFNWELHCWEVSPLKSIMDLSVMYEKLAVPREITKEEADKYIMLKLLES